MTKYLAPTEGGHTLRARLRLIIGLSGGLSGRDDQGQRATQFIAI